MDGWRYIEMFSVEFRAVVVVGIGGRVKFLGWGVRWVIDFLG